MSLPNTNITVGAPPLLWSDVNEAFTRINENFDSIAASLGVAGITPINFETLDTSLKPTVDNLYELGDITHKWRSIYTGEFSTVDSLNGLWAGNAQIKGIGFTVNLPANSTIGGDPITGIGTSLIIDPDKTFFKFIQIDNNESIAATEFGDTVNLLSGDGISMTVNSGADSITVENTGILNMLSGDGINVSIINGVSTVTNTGVRSLTNATSLPAGRALGAGINISAGTGDNINITNTGILSAVGGIGIAAQIDSDTGLLTITNSAPAVNAFAQIEINGDSGDRISADLVSDVLFINSGLGITLTKNAGADAFTIAVNPVFDLTGNVLGNVTGNLLGNVTGNVLGNVTGNVLGNVTGYHTGDMKGSVFGDDSGKIVDAVEGKVYADLFGNVVGNITGNLTGNVLGNLTGNVTGNADTATTANIATSVTLTATDSTNAAHFITFVDTATGNESVRTDTSLTYNPSTNILTAGTFSGNLNGNVSGTVTGNVFTNLIDSADSSAITVTPITIFSSDVIVENDLNVTQRFLLRGSRILNLAELKLVVAASTSFSDFQTRIAALV
jgi:hypothetical protein